MIILENAEQKIREFNDYPDRPRESYHRVLNAKEGRKSFVGENGNVNPYYIHMIDWALRSYFMMNRGNRMGSKEQFTNKLIDKVSIPEIKKILARLRVLSITSPNFNNCRPDAEELYNLLSHPEHGLSSDGTHFCVGATKVMHNLFPELFIMLDQIVGRAVGYRPSQYNNFGSYWNAMDICRKELEEWQEKHGDIDSLLQLDNPPTTLPRIFDKCASIMGIRLKSV